MLAHRRVSVRRRAGRRARRRRRRAGRLCGGHRRHASRCEPADAGLLRASPPDLPRLLRMVEAAIGRGVPLLLPPYGPGLGVDARSAPVTAEDHIHIAAMPDTRAPQPRRTWLPHELLVDGGDLVDRSRSAPRPAGGRVRHGDVHRRGAHVRAAARGRHAPRMTIGHVVVRRESWSLPPGEVPSAPREIPAFARDHGMPRRLFTKSPLERKPMYLDVESPALARIFCRHARQRGGSSTARADPFHRDVADAGAVLAQRPRGQPLRLRATPRRGR